MSRYDLSPAELAELLPDEPQYRVAQLRDGLYRLLVEPAEISTLPRALRDRLGKEARLAAALHPLSVRASDSGGTTKWLFELADGRTIETVLMHYPGRSTVCVSSQAGCAMGCTFCATGDGGFFRNLGVGEIVEQVVRAGRAAAESDRRLSRVVFMGMGEPLANRRALFAAIDRIVTDLGYAQRHLTVSTVGLVPGIDQFARRYGQVNLAVSLHAANDELRNRLVPMNRRYPLETLTAACARYVATTNRRISFEWALMADVNDSAGDAVELAQLARPLGAHVNLIPLNPTPGGLARGLRGSPRSRVLEFRRLLLEHGVNATIRQTRGQEIDAACGQLAAAPSAERADDRRLLTRRR